MAATIRDAAAGPAPTRALPGARASGAAAVAAAAVYAAGDLLCGLRYDGYSHRDQAISELSAFGSPVRTQAVAFLTVHGLLLGTFAVGLWRARRTTAGARLGGLHRAGPPLLAAVLVGLVLHPFVPMSSRGMDPGPHDTAHMALTAVFVVLVLSAATLVAVTSRGLLRSYTALTVLAMAGFGVLAGTAAPTDLRAAPPTPYLGVHERLNAYAYLTWVAVLGVVLYRRATAARDDRRPPRQRARDPRRHG